MPDTDKPYPLTPEQFESLILLVLKGANVVAARRLNKDPQKLEDAERQFDAQKAAARRDLVGSA